MKEVAPATVNEHVFELRFKPNARVLDRRGEWAEMLSRELSLSEWNIGNNRIDVFAKDQSSRAFVAFRNTGLTMRDTPTADLFADKAIKLLKIVCRLPEFGTKLHVERLGVRSKFGTGATHAFAELVARFTDRYSGPVKGSAVVFGEGTKLVDVGAPLNFTDRLGQLNTMSGPMTREQFAQFFAKDEGFPEVGLFFDVDYWLKPNAVMEEREIAGHVKAFASEAWAKNQRFVDLLVGR